MIRVMWPMMYSAEGCPFFSPGLNKIISMRFRVNMTKFHIFHNLPQWNCIRSKYIRVLWGCILFVFIFAAEPQRQVLMRQSQKIFAARKKFHLAMPLEPFPVPEADRAGPKFSSEWDSSTTSRDVMVWYHKLTIDSCRGAFPRGIVHITGLTRCDWLYTSEISQNIPKNSRVFFENLRQSCIKVDV